jgi:large subunit ribosomal protein L23
MKDLILEPRLSEKAYGQSTTSNVYTFVVPTDANKQTVAQAVSQQFNVTVTAVNIAVNKGKVVRSYRKRSRGITGTRANTKKAYVTVKEGDSIAIFDVPEEPKATKAEKKATKATKETK